MATGNRAGFLILVAMFPVLLFSFKRELGAQRVTRYLVGGVAVLVLASALAISYTGFGRMFERLENVTETQDGVPTTRALTWPVAIEKIKQHPWVGEGPFFVNPEAGQNLGMPRSEVDPYPHSLYLLPAPDDRHPGAGAHRLVLRAIVASAVSVATPSRDQLVYVSDSARGHAADSGIPDRAGHAGVQPAGHN